MIIFFITFSAGLVSSVLSINSSQAAPRDNYIGIALNEQFRIGYAIKSMSEYREFTEDEINIYLLGTVRNAALSYSEYYNTGNAGASFRISSV
jgi:hypothetical protein